MIDNSVCRGKKQLLKKLVSYFEIVNLQLLPLCSACLFHDFSFGLALQPVFGSRCLLSGFEKLVSLSCGLFDFYVLHIWSQCWSFCFPIGGLQPIFCKPHNSRDLSWQCVVRWPLPLGISLTFRIVPLRVQSGRCGHFVLSLGTVRFKQPGMRPTPVPQKKKSDQKKKTKKNRAVA